MDAHGNLDRDRLQWLAEHPFYGCEPWRPIRTLRSGPCALCAAALGDYDSKWIHPDGRLVCSSHWLWSSDVLPPTAAWRYYTDG